ncbi:MAG: DUF3310 domain-containing protein [Bilophila wadsworthia]
MDAAQYLQDQIRPPYYTRFRIEPLAFITMNHLDFLQGNIIKYVCRYDDKNGARRPRRRPALPRRTHQQNANGGRPECSGNTITIISPC